VTARGVSAKILGIERLCAERERARSAGERVVHCHGCFDIVHPGHVRHLQHARSLGDRLFVSITADDHVNKGAGRPLFTEDLRAENVAALSCVDWVYVSPTPTAEPLLERVRPDLYLKGQEYEDNDDPRFARERATVERHGGRVVFSSGDVVFSSTALVEALGEREAGDDPLPARLRQLRGATDLGAGRLAALLDDVRDRRVVIVGETVVDTYVHCAWPEVTGESPVLALRPVEQTSYDGGAAIIARHAAALGARPTLVTALPRSDDAAALVERLQAEGIEVIPVASEAPLPTKERFVVGREKVVKLDRTRPQTLDTRARSALLDAVADSASTCDAAIIADYGLGMLGPRLTASICDAVRPRVDVLAGDVSGPRAALLAMRGADWLSPSERELRGALGHADRSLPAIAWDLMLRTDVRHVVVTMGADGLVAFRRLDRAAGHDGNPSRLAGEHVPALVGSATDALGCGDALLATGVMSLAAGGDIVAAAYLGSVAAAVEASVLGNTPVTRAAIDRVVARLDRTRPTVHTVARAARIAG
jgi:rfaE bifunctional protein kinase chain/domain/rfaE bifunctional protein nucleotidyltransferase chain/domain